MNFTKNSVLDPITKKKPDTRGEGGGKRGEKEKGREGKRERSRGKLNSLVCSLI